MTGPFLLSISFLVVFSLLFLFFGSVWHIKLAARQLWAHENIVGLYRIVSYNATHPVWTNLIATHHWQAA